MNGTQNQSSTPAASPRRLCLVALIVAALSGLSGATGLGLATASKEPRQGGVNIPMQGDGFSKAPRFGHRILKVGMVGRDVGVLRAMVNSKSVFAKRSFLLTNTVFDPSTAEAVKRFQRRAGIAASGVVTRGTADRLKGAMRGAGASWYGPGFYGGRTACGQKLRESTVGVAHKTLPCGSKVLIGYRGRFLLTRVIDRGPFIAGRSWDLTNGARVSLGYEGIDRVRSLVVARR